MTMKDFELDRRLEALPRAANTPEALWPAIEQRITRRRRRMWISGIAAAVVVAVLIDLIANNFEDFTTPDINATLSLAATVFAAEVDAMRHTAPDAELLAHAEHDANWEEAWRLNETAIGELEQALHQNPDNRLLLEFLARARLRQSELINQATVGTAVAHHRSS